MKRAVRMGKLANGKLIGGEEGDSEEDVTAEDDRAAAMLELLRRGEVTNVGPSSPAVINEVPLVFPTSGSSEPTTEPDVSASPKRSKISKFKLSLAQTGEPLPPSSSFPTPSSVPQTPMSACPPIRLSHSLIIFHVTSRLKFACYLRTAIATSIFHANLRCDTDSYPPMLRQGIMATAGWSSM